MKTDEELQAWLVARCDLIKPDGCIVTNIHGTTMVPSWRDTNTPVTSREWDWVVRQVVGLLSPVQFVQFVANLGKLFPRNAQFLTWQQRTLAVMKTLDFN